MREHVRVAGLGRRGALALFALLSAACQPAIGRLNPFDPDNALDKAALPIFSPAAGTYADPQLVTILTNSEGAELHYTMDGSTPTSSSTLYVEPVAVGRTTHLKAVAVAAGLSDSDVAEAVYTIVSTASPRISVVLGATAVDSGGSVDIGGAVVGTDKDVTLTVLNTGDAPLVLPEQPVTVSGADASQFAVTLQPVSPVESGGSTGVTLRFSPTTPGIKTALLSIANNDPLHSP